MLSASRTPVPCQTATIREHSIWRDVPQDVFRRHLVTLQERTNSVPIRPRNFIASPSRCSSHLLSFEDEQSIADDLAYLAAVGEGAQSVAAVCIEECSKPAGLRLLFASADAFDPQSSAALRKVGDLLMLSASSDPSIKGESTKNDLLYTITYWHAGKLRGRLRSAKWQKPIYLSRTHKKPLWQDFDNVIHRVQHIYLGKNHPGGARVRQRLNSLREKLKDYESIAITGDHIALQDVVTACFSFCRSSDIGDFTGKLEAITKPTNQISAALKTIQQVEKIGSYYRIVFDLLNKAQKYSTLFKDLQIDYLQPYKALPTDIGYETWAKTTHVHAEVQLIVHYDCLVSRQESITKQFSMPRTIGTSKYLCYLCYLFMKHHGGFHPPNTHGRLYDQWTIPDQENFELAVRSRYQTTIKAMNTEIVELTCTIPAREGKRETWRKEPMTSRQNLILRSTTETTGEDESSSGITKAAEA